MPCLWCDGKWIDDGLLPISPDDRGLLHGLAAFETMLAVDGVIRHAEKHLLRLQMAVDVLGLPPLGVSDLGAVVAELCAKNHCNSGRARIRLSLTAGEGTLRQLRPGLAAHTWISAGPCPLHNDPINAVTLPWLRNEHSPLVGLKTCSYAENLVALDWARQQGADEGIFFNTCGQLCEGVTSNIFLWISDTVFTPPLSSGCLPGVIREVVIERAQQLGITVRVEEISRQRFAQAEGIFFTSATRGMIPAARCDGKTLVVAAWLAALMQACS